MLYYHIITMRMKLETFHLCYPREIITFKGRKWEDLTQKFNMKCSNSSTIILKPLCASRVPPGINMRICPSGKNVLK